MQTANTQTSGTQTSGTQTSDTQTSGTQTSDTQTSDTQTTSNKSTASYDIRIAYTDEDTNECFFRDIPLGTISQITLCMDGTDDDAIPYAKYLTGTSTKEVSTLDAVKERLGITDDSESESDSTDDSDKNSADDSDSTDSNNSSDQNNNSGNGTGDSSDDPGNGGNSDDPGTNDDPGSNQNAVRSGSSRRKCYVRQLRWITPIKRDCLTMKCPQKVLCPTFWGHFTSRVRQPANRG